jgi:hypothetical protein
MKQRPRRGIMERRAGRIALTMTPCVVVAVMKSEAAFHICGLEV